jgi:hypothetical protein
MFPFPTLNRECEYRVSLLASDRIDLSSSEYSRSSPLNLPTRSESLLALALAKSASITLTCRSNVHIGNKRWHNKRSFLDIH